MLRGFLIGIFPLALLASPVIHPPIYSAFGAGPTPLFLDAWGSEGTGPAEFQDTGAPRRPAVHLHLVDRIRGLALDSGRISYAAFH